MSQLIVDLLIADQLHCVRGERVLFENLSFRLQRGECLHIRGANGSGKTSLLRILIGLLAPTNGQVHWQLSNSDANPVYLGHKNALKNELRAIENLRFYQKLDGRSDEDELDTVLHQVGLLEQAEQLTSSLSFGQKRRLAFARLLLGPSPVWILDEPFTGVDAQGRDTLEAHCENHLASANSIILTHHGNLENSQLANRLRVLEL